MNQIKIALIGYPVKKSLSPLIFKKIAGIIKKDILFDLIETENPDPRKILRDNSYNGFFITIPYKRMFYRYAIPDRISKELKIVNCLKREGNKFYATNSDYKAIKKLCEGFKLDGKTATILGNGATAYISSYFLIRKGIKKINISARNHKKSFEIIKLLNKKGLDFELLKFPESGGTELLINATPLGMYFNEKINIDKKNEFIIDFAYKKDGTQLINHCIDKKIKHISGTEILIMQALYGFEFITSINIKKYYNKILREFS